MTVGEFISSATKKLREAGVESARLDCLLLLEDAMGKDRALLLAHPETKITPKTEAELNKKIVQRGEHVPLAYIRGKVLFYGHEFIIDKNVLVPRPETEAMITLLKQQKLSTFPRVADIGTGSGCIGITAALEIKNASVDLYDIDKKALSVARQNAQKHHISTVTHKSDLLKVYQGSHDVLLANLPYVPNNYAVNRAAKHEPPQALFAGTDGLDVYRRFWREIKALAQKPQLVLTESLTQQHQKLAALASAAGYTIKTSSGLVQCFAHTLAASRLAPRQG